MTSKRPKLTMAQLRAALADPVPPAGGEPAIYALSYYNDVGGYAPKMVLMHTLPEHAERGGYVLEADHRAHVTRLQAEVEEWKASNKENALVAGELVERLNSKIDTMRNKNNELNDNVADLQSELTKARELFRDIADDPEMWSICSIALARRIDEQLSNQSAPADKECSHRFMSLADDPRRCADCDAVETHDEPVVRLELVRSGASEGLHIRVWENLGNLWPGVHMLYLGPPEQPAPVAVVLPERKSVNTHNSHDWDEGHADGWVAYDTELKRLNPSL